MPKRKKYARLHVIEHETGRTVSINSRLPSAASHAQMNPQSGSRLFELPPELRLVIYEYVLAPFDDKKRSYKPTKPYYWPGYEAPHVTDTSLLLTCRLIWMEANHVPLKLATPTFWFYNGPYDDTQLQKSSSIRAVQNRESGASSKPDELLRYQTFFERLTPLNLTQIEHVRLFITRSWVEGWHMTEYFDTGCFFGVRKLTLTIKGLFWIGGCSPRWLEDLLKLEALKNVREICVELGAATQKQQLYQVADMLKAYSSDYFQPAGTREERKQTHLILTLRWTNRVKEADSAQLQTHEAENFEPIRRPLLKKDKKRGGRRGNSVWCRNHYRTVELDSNARKSNKAVDVIERWAEKGSLLRLA